ncbi:hypothetical protein C8J56DRAFT_837778 [Mycena floridula]|nr:hypothetical protein C8J56DRAFT_837778 [Mycena floridula]
MSHPLVWPGKYFFYPIGNTAAVCLTRDIAPEEDAKLLLLGCGDPRNVLYTIYSEPENSERKLDFTCCDIDPAVLTRNVLLFTMVVDKVPITTIWNIFFHMKINQESYDALLLQCQKLVDSSETMDQWKASSYSPFLKMSSSYTLSEVRRHCKLYMSFRSLPPNRQKTIRDAFSQVEKLSPVAKGGTFLGAARSSGPLIMAAAPVLSKMLVQYWATGVTDPKPPASASLLNPTFVYSLGGEGCCVHYGTDPMTPFHLVDLFGNAKRDITASDVIQAARRQFTDWCTAYASAVSSATAPIVRLFAGDAIAVSSALAQFAVSRTCKTGIPASQFNVSRIELDTGEYGSGRAPVYFNIIDTSNLNDHIGLLNVLIAAAPLLENNIASVLYSESLLFRGDDATKEFTELLHTEIPLMALLLGLCPVDYLSRFTSLSNTHELMMHMLLKGKTAQFYQVSTWKRPWSADPFAFDLATIPTFEPIQLGTMLWDMYHLLFEQEDARTFWDRNGGPGKAGAKHFMKAVSHSNILHYSRKTFAEFLKVVKSRLNMTPEAWMSVMDRFTDLQEADQSMPMDTVNRQDMFAQLHLQGVYTVDLYRESLRKVGRFAAWPIVPPVLRVIISVPRDKLLVLGVPDPTDPMNKDTMTIPMHCDVRGKWSHNTFNDVHVGFGRVSAMGSPSHPRVAFEEDSDGWMGTAPLVASFTMPTQLLVNIEPQEDLTVHLSIRSTSGTAMTFVSKLGLTLSVFSARFLDTSLVQVLPEDPVPTRSDPSLNSRRSSTALAQIGELQRGTVQLDEECEVISTFTSRINVTIAGAKHLFGTERKSPEVVQISPCVVRVNLANYVQDVIFPFPVSASQHRLRLARASMYIEIIVPPSGPFLPDGMKVRPFSVLGNGTALTSWNIHRVNLARLPAVNYKADIGKWLNPHVGSMMSTRERSLRKKHDTDTLMFVKDTIHAILVQSMGIQGSGIQRLFALRDKETNNCDTIIFVNGVRYDTHCHTVICDSYVLPLTNSIIMKHQNEFGKLVSGGKMVNVTVYEGEMTAWKHLLPAFTERCRTWKHGPNCEYLATGKIPLTEEMEVKPLCSCGSGKDVEGMRKVDLWRPFAPYTTRMALSPLFAVSYLERVIRDPASRRCHVCRARGKPKLQQCITCKKVRYCSKECQKKDWNKHKVKCSATTNS